MPEQPESFPPNKVEILPPERQGQSYDHGSYSSTSGTVRIIRIGPLGAIAMMLAFGLMLGVGLLFLSGMVLIIFAAFVIFGSGAYLANRLRGFWRLPR